MQSSNKMRKKLGYAVMAGALVSVPFALQAAERKMLVSSFKDIVIENDVRVELTTGKSPKAVVTGEKAQFPNVKLSNRSNTLVVQFREPTLGNFRKPVKEPLLLKLSNHELQNVTLQGNSVFSADKLHNTGTATILVAGNGELNIQNVIADNLIITVAGNAKVKLASGKVDNGTIRIFGSGNVDAGGVSFRDLEIAHDGNAESSAKASNAVRIYNNGGGSISITGKANCFIERASSATIDCPKYGK